MTILKNNYDSNQLPVRSLVVTFRKPAGMVASIVPLCDQFGTVVDMNVDGIRYYSRESPAIVQPDILVDGSLNKIIGLSFELTSPEWMAPRCKRMLRTLDSRAIRISERELDYIALEVLWARCDNYERRFAQLDYGLWAFLYSTPDPTLLRDGDDWTPPDGLVIGDVSQLEFKLSVSLDDYANIVAEAVCPIDE